MSRVQSQWRDQREDVAQVPLTQLGSLNGAQFSPAQNADVVLRQQRQQAAFDAQPMLREFAHPGRTFRDLLLRCAAVDGHLRHTGGGL